MCLQHFGPLCSMFLMFSLYIIVSVTACNTSSSSHPSSCQNVTMNLYCVGINFFSFLLFLHSFLLFCFLFLWPFFLLSLCHSNFSRHPFLLLLFLCPSTFFLFPPVSISPPGAGPQLCGVPVLLPTWAERLYPPGPPPGANDRAVPGQRQPLPRIQPQQQVGRTSAGNDYESWWTLNTSWFQKNWAAGLTVLALNVVTTLL